MSLSAYLAQNYLTADAGSERRGKKRKRKEANSGIRIADDDLSIAKSKTDNNDDEDRPTTSEYLDLTLRIQSADIA